MSQLTAYLDNNGKTCSVQKRQGVAVFTTWLV